MHPERGQKSVWDKVEVPQSHVNAVGRPGPAGFTCGRWLGDPVAVRPRLGFLSARFREAERNPVLIHRVGVFSLHDGGLRRPGPRIPRAESAAQAVPARRFRGKQRASGAFAPGWAGKSFAPRPNGILHEQRRPHASCTRPQRVDGTSFRVATAGNGQESLVLLGNAGRSRYHENGS